MGALLDRLEGVVDRIERAAPLDGPAEALASGVNAAFSPTPVKNALSGTWLGHPLHPLLVAMPIGSWVMASCFDLAGGEAGRNGADALVALGLASAVPTVATGLANWSDLYGADRRVGLVHAAANAVGTAFFAASLVQRRRGKRVAGNLLQLTGLAAMSAGGYLGGHIVYRRGVGVDHTAFDDVARDWTTVARLADLTDGKAHAAEIEGVTLLLVRTGDGVSAIANACSHESGPLHEGEIADGCVTCPWHGSRFDLTSGAVVRGPATAPQPVYDVRVQGGDVQVRTRVAE